PGIARGRVRHRRHHRRQRRHVDALTRRQNMNAITGCPFHPANKDFKPYYSPELHAAFEMQRRREPVFWSDEIGYWVLTKHSDVYSLLHDGERFPSQNPTRPVT